MSFYDVFSTLVLPEMSFYDVFLTFDIFPSVFIVFLTLSNFEMLFYTCFTWFWNGEMSFYDVFSTFVPPEMSFYDVFLTLVIFLLRFGCIFEGFRKRAKIIGDYRWEVLTFAKSSGHFTRCFGGQVHQALYLCSREPRGRWGTFPGQTGVFFHIQVRTLSCWRHV